MELNKPVSKHLPSAAFCYPGFPRRASFRYSACLHRRLSLFHQVTTKRLPFMKHYGDVSKMNGGEIEPVDIITSAFLPGYVRRLKRAGLTAAPAFMKPSES